MPKYRKRPVVIEAERFYPADWPPHEPKIYPCGVYKERDKYYIDTLEGRHIVTPGDYIITGIQGERYPCKPDIFEATYERVEVGADDTGKD